MVLAVGALLESLDLESYHRACRFRSALRRIALTMSLSLPGLGWMEETWAAWLPFTLGGDGL